ncbi:MAG: CusA/CzcA family heavy metal efflux RND transporter [Sandaracinaceae bacterium]|nr:CusA/CzcA family heavy metal efflux RND transporter [Sandaracinaceae bacterium]
MLESLVRTSINNRVIFALITFAILVAGFFVVPALPVDAVPDLTNTQVSVITEAPGLSAEQVERFVTLPIEMALNGMPMLSELRSITRGGLSVVTAVFKDGTDVWFARYLVLERLREAESSLPPTAGPPQLGPVSSGLGEIYRFVLRSDRHDAMALRTILDWEIAPRLRQVPGVIEVNAMGGAAKEYHVVLDPKRLAAHGISLGEVVSALEHNNAAVGGGWVERGPELMVIRGESQFRDTSDIASVVVKTEENGTPILIKHLGDVRIGAALPYGVVTMNGESDAVTGVVMMRIGANSREVVHAVHAKLAAIQKDLPEGVVIDTVYDRADFIRRTLKTVATNLVEGALLVAIVVFAFLRNWRASLLVTLGIPFSMIVAISGMLWFGIDGNLMSLGAIDFGFLVDGPIVMVEAIVARFALEQVMKDFSPVQSVKEALERVARPVVFSVLIILLVYLPLLTLEGTEGKMFRPMAATMGLALFGSVLFSLIAFPALSALFLRPSSSSHTTHHHEGQLEHHYRRSLRKVLEARFWVIGAGALAFILCLPLLLSLGADFVPRIEEGDIVVVVKRIPSVGLTEARRLDLEVQQVLRRFPEVLSTVAMNGRPEVATEPVGMDSTDILVRLRPHAEWKTAHDLDALGEAIKRAIESEVPASFVSVSQPIEDRTNELISGSRADVAIVLFGDELARMSDIAKRIGRLVAGISGAGDIRIERVLGLPMIEVEIDRKKLARYGLTAEDALIAVEALRQGRKVGQLFEGQKRFDVRVLLPPSEPGLEGLRRLPVGAFRGNLVPLGQVAEVREVDGPSQISRRDMQRRIRVEVNIRGRDLVSFVNEARALVERMVVLPPGYRIEWGGQFENFERATKRLGVVLPMALGIIFAMLFVIFGSARHALAVFTGVPLAAIGGVVGLALRGMSFSIPAAVGFIALSGIAVLNGVVMASEVERRIQMGAECERAIIDGATSVLRAMLLTATVAALGFLPMALSTSAGSEVQRPLATTVIGGMVSSTLLGLFVLPALLYVFLRERARVQLAAPSP